MHPSPPAFQNVPMPAEPSPGQQPDDGYFEDLQESAWTPDQAMPALVDDGFPARLDQRGTKSQTNRRSAQKQPTPQQLKFWADQTAAKNSIAAKLREIGFHDRADKLEACHTTYTVGTCLDCGRQYTFPNRCDLFYCPECYHSLCAHRTAQVSWWVAEILQPKHVCLTIKNIPDLTPGHVDELRAMFHRLRKRKFCRNWIGGFYSIQLTHRMSGWHLHIHALINAAWIDQNELSRQWESVTRGAGKITCVKNCREKSYLSRITAYVAKGNDLAGWSHHLIQQFILAFEGKRTFAVFGSLFGLRTKFAEWLKSIRDRKPRCECGSCNVTFQSEVEWLASDFTIPAAARPPPPPETPSFNSIAHHFLGYQNSTH